MGHPHVMTDDTEHFRAERLRRVQQMAADENVRRLDRELLVESDRHDWSYAWDWLGLPIIQMPTDVQVMQEIIWSCRPQVVVETGVARGGSLILYSSILQLIGEGEVLGVDIDIRAHNRSAIEAHPMSKRISLIEGSSVSEDVLAEIRRHIGTAERVMVVLDSNHTHEHVLAELRLYSELVTVGQFLVVADTMVEEVPPQLHRPREWGPGNNPATAVRDFLAADDRFAPDEHVNAKLLLTSSRGGYLRRMS
jgi:cephalosporin hydroxylase